jgi:hypothetical protein
MYLWGRILLLMNHLMILKTKRLRDEKVQAARG